MATQTKRRTTQITQPKAKPKPVYEGVVLARVYHPETGAFLGYLAKPSKPTDVTGRIIAWYQITRDLFGVWHCKCNASGDCKHKDAVKDLEAISPAPAKKSAVASSQPAQEQGVAVPAEPVSDNAETTENEVPANVTPIRRKPVQHVVRCVCGHDRIVGPTFTEEELVAMAAQKCSECDATKEVVVLSGGVKARVEEAPKGDLHGIQRRGGFLDACFGRSPEMAKYRARYEARVAK